MMTAIITGDIKNSRSVNPELWIKPLKSVLQQFGSEPEKWELYRGDSFQLELEPKRSVEASLKLKAAVKQVKGLNIRLAIGVGDKNYQAAKVTESNGTAFVFSGESFEALKKQTLRIKTAWKDFDAKINIMFELASLTMDSWTPKSAEIVLGTLNNPAVNQQELAEILGIKQSNISRGLSRAGFDEIIKMANYYQEEIKRLC